VSRRITTNRLSAVTVSSGERRKLLVFSEAQVEEWGQARGTVLHAALSEGRVLVEA
jgi:hypothetical protein